MCTKDSRHGAELRGEESQHGTSARSVAVAIPEGRLAWVPGGVSGP